MTARHLDLLATTIPIVVLLGKFVYDWWCISRWFEKRSEKLPKTDVKGRLDLLAEQRGRAAGSTKAAFGALLLSQVLSFLKVLFYA